MLFHQPLKLIFIALATFALLVFLAFYGWLFNIFAAICTLIALFYAIALSIPQDKAASRQPSGKLSASVGISFLIFGLTLLSHARLLGSIFLIIGSCTLPFYLASPAFNMLLSYPERRKLEKQKLELERRKAQEREIQDLIVNYAVKFIISRIFFRIF